MSRAVLAGKHQSACWWPSAHDAEGNPLARQLGKLHIYAGAEHPRRAKPVAIDFKSEPQEREGG